MNVKAQQGVEKSLFGVFASGARQSHSQRNQIIIDCHACVPKLHATKNPCVQALRRAGTSSRYGGTPRNDRLLLFFNRLSNFEIKEMSWD